MSEFRIRELRKARGLTQEALGSLAKTDRAATVSELERGVANPKLRTLRQLAEALDVTIPELFDVSPDALRRLAGSKGGEAIVVVDEDPDKAAAQRQLLDIVRRLPRTDAEKLATAAEVMLQATLTHQLRTKGGAGTDEG